MCELNVAVTAFRLQVLLQNKAWTVFHKAMFSVLSASCTGKSVVAFLRACFLSASHCIVHVKGKSIPLQVWTGPEGSRRLRLPDFKTIGT